MSKLDEMRALVNQMLTTAVETLFVEFQKKITEYEDEIVFLKEENESKRKLLDKVLNPVVRLHKAGFQESVSGSESEASTAQQQLNQTKRKHLEPETQHIKEEPKENEDPEQQEEPEEQNEKEDLEEPEEQGEPEEQKEKEEPEEQEEPEEPEEQKEKEEPEEGVQRHAETNIDLHLIKGEPEEDFQKAEYLQRNPIDEIEENKSLFWRFLSEVEGRQKEVGASEQGPQQKALSTQSQGQGSKQVPANRHQCTICSKDFIKKERLKIHMRVHTGEKPYTCQQCGACFSQRGSLGVHMKIHSGLRPYHCPICNKSFGVKNTLKLHAQVHAITKPFSCSRCGKRFNFKVGLIGHLRHHVSGMLLDCNACGQDFCTKSDLKKHLAMQCPNMKPETESQESDSD